VFGMMLFAVLGISQALSQLPEVFKTKAADGPRCPVN